MSQKSNFIFATTETISSTATAGTTFKITTDFETGQVVELPEATSYVQKDATQIERFEITATGGVATIVKRGLEKGDTSVENVALQKPWGDGTVGYTTLLAFNVFDREDDNTLADGKKIQFGSSAAYIFSDDNGVNLKFKDGSNAEINLSTISAAAGADTKVAISTLDTTPSQLEDKLTAGDGISFTKINPAGNESLDVDIDLITTNGLKFTTNQLDIEPATNTQIGTQRISTDAEIDTGALENVSVNPKQVKDTQGLYNGGDFTRDLSLASGTIVVAHGLSRPPKKITFTYSTDSTDLGPYSGFAVGTSINKTIGISQATNDTFDGSNCIRFGNATNFNTALVTAIDATNYTLTVTKTASPTGTLNVIWTAEA